MLQVFFFFQKCFLNPRGAGPSYSWAYFKCCDQSHKYAQAWYFGSLWHQDKKLLSREITLIALNGSDQNRSGKMVILASSRWRHGSEVRVICSQREYTLSTSGSLWHSAEKMARHCCVFGCTNTQKNLTATFYLIPSAKVRVPISRKTTMTERKCSFSGE